MLFNFDAAVQAPFRMQPGLRRLPAGAQQLTPALPGSRHQREKLAVLSAFADSALQKAEGFDPQPALLALAAHAAQEHAQHLAWDGQRAVALGVAVQHGKVQRQSAGSFGLGDEVERCLLGLPPAWRLPGLLSLTFEEDFAVIDAQAAVASAARATSTASGAVLAWLAVALPSHWAPANKVGRPFADVHAPVADNFLLLQAADALSRLVTGPERWERFVWNVSDHPRLHAHPDRVDPDRWRGRFDPARAWWRTERQTFLPLPGLRQAVFTIGVQVQPLATALQADQARCLHDAVASMSEAVLTYRCLDRVREPLLAWLAGQAADV